MTSQAPARFRRQVKAIGYDRVLYDEQITETAHGDDCKIQNIIKKYRETGVIDHINSQQPQYLDLSDSYTLKEAMDKVQQADEVFMTLPATIRDDFQNDKGKFVDFMQNPENIEKIQEYGFDTSYFPHTQKVQALADPLVPHAGNPAPDPAPDPTPQVAENPPAT